MSVQELKTRLVSFRLSETEYAELLAMCRAQRARSLSCFVRENVHLLLRQPAAAPLRISLRSSGELSSGSFTSPAHANDCVCRTERPSPPGILVLTNILFTLRQRTDELDRQMHDLLSLASERFCPSPAAGADLRGGDAQASAAHWTEGEPAAGLERQEGCQERG